MPYRSFNILEKMVDKPSIISYFPSTSDQTWAIIRVLELILLSLDCIFLICSASRICIFCLLYCCSNIVAFSVRIFCNCVVGIECFFNICSMELVSERCITSLLDRVAEIKTTYVLLFSEIQSPKGHLNWYNVVFLQNSNRGRGIILND